MADVKRPRRFYLHKRLQARDECDDSERVWQAKQEAEPGTALPADFPLNSELAASGYTTVEDIDGADEDELVKINLTSRQARAVLAALKPLL